MKTNKKYGYELLRFWQEPFLAIKYISKLIWYNQTGRLFYCRDMPTWFVRYYGTTLYKISKRSEDQSDKYIYKKANSEWLRRKRKLLKLELTKNYKLF